ncbi:MAG: acetoacetate decarboxylase family protein [Candidatus Geothermincolia bacterium]
MQDEFFAGIDQVELKVDGGQAKFPIFYRDARMFTVVLPANYLALKRMLPDPRFAPAQVLPGVGAIYLAAFEYFDVDIGPYNEFAIGILLNTPHYAGIPGYNMLRQYFAGFFNAFVYHLPVTTEIALRAGRDFYNYPKFLAGIDFSDSGTGVTCDLSRDDEHVLTISGGKVPVSRLGEMKFICNLYQYRQPQQAEFKLNVIEGSINWLPKDVSWAFNRSSEIGRELANTVAGSRALMYMYFPKIQCILYGPEYIPIPLMQHTVLSPGFMPRSKPAGKKKSAGPPKK